MFSENQRIQRTSTEDNISSQQQYPSHNNPNLVRIKAQDTSPRQYCIIGWAFIALTVLMIILAVAMGQQYRPYFEKTNETQLKNTLSKNCKNPSGFTDDILVCRPFSENYLKIGLILRGVSPLNQFAFINFTPDEHFKSAFNNTKANIILYSLHFEKQSQQGKDYGIFKEGKIIAERTYVYKADQFIGIYRRFEEKDYLLVVQFQNQRDYKFEQNQRPELKATLIKEQSSIALIIIRAVLAVYTLCRSIIFIIMFCKLPKSHRFFQQKLIIILSISTLLLNNPLYTFVVLQKSLHWTIVDFVLVGQCFVFWMAFVVYLNFRSNVCANYGMKYKMKMSDKALLGVFFGIFVGLLAAYYLRFVREAYQTDQAFITDAIHVSPVLGILTYVMFGLWAIYVIAKAFCASLQSDFFPTKVIQFMVGLILILTALSMLVTFFSNEIYWKISIIAPIYGFFGFNFLLSFVQYLFTASNFTLFSGNKTLEIESLAKNTFIELQDDEFQKTQISLDNISSHMSKTRSDKY